VVGSDAGNSRVLFLILFWFTLATSVELWWLDTPARSLTSPGAGRLRPGGATPGGSASPMASGPPASRSACPAPTGKPPRRRSPPRPRQAQERQVHRGRRAGPAYEVVTVTITVSGGKITGGHRLEQDLADHGVTVLRPNRKTEKTRPGQALLKSVRQLIESVNDTLKGQLDLELHGGRTFAGIAVRVAQRLLAMTAAIWHNHEAGQPTTRSLIAYDH